MTAEGDSALQGVTGHQVKHSNNRPISGLTPHMIGPIRQDNGVRCQQPNWPSAVDFLVIAFADNHNLIAESPRPFGRMHLRPDCTNCRHRGSADRTQACVLVLLQLILECTCLGHSLSPAKTCKLCCSGRKSKGFLRPKRRRVNQPAGGLGILRDHYRREFERPDRSVRPTDIATTRYARGSCPDFSQERRQPAP